MRLVVFTDLDGTLLDHHSYGYAPAQPALDALAVIGAGIRSWWGDHGISIALIIGVAWVANKVMGRAIPRLTRQFVLRVSATRVDAELARVAPITETPTVPPSDRKNVTPELATPISVGRAVFCTMRTRFCIVVPTPAPRRNMYSDTRAKFVS